MIKEVAFIIAHYHPAGLIDPHLKRFIKCAASTKSIVKFVSTNISDEEKNEISEFCEVISRPNFGYDFWSYKIGLDNIKFKKNLQKIIFLNSSFISLYPEKLIEKALAKSEKSGLTGMTISNQKIKHIQSYWISFDGNDLINSRVFKNFWDNMIPISARQNVIDTYEIGISKTFSENGYELRSIFQPSNADNLISICRAIALNAIALGEVNSTIEINTSDGQIFNPTHYLWDKILERVGIIKIELLRYNPTRQDIQRIKEIIDVGQYEMIKKTIASYDINI